MNDKENLLREFIELKDYNSINDFLIEISRSANEKDLTFVDILMNVPDLELRKSYILNLVYYFGVLGKNTILDAKYIIFMKNAYFQSDRWVRNEILSSILNFIHKIKPDEDIFNVIRNAISDEYQPIKLNAIRILDQIDIFPEDILVRVILSLKSNDSEIIPYSIRVIKKSIKSNQILINLLEKLNQLSPNVDLMLVRNVLTTLYESVIELERFREDLLKSTLIDDYKQKFLNEIKIMQKILIEGRNR